ncbi:MAG: hypothetical protein HKM04_08500 [Legionellales bacterium]|nr:hypothetical protein [Legionellales bacterium]
MKDNKNNFFINKSKKEPKIARKSNFPTNVYDVPQRDYALFPFVTTIVSNPEKIQRYPAMQEKYTAILDEIESLDILLLKLDNLHINEPDDWQTSLVGRYLLIEAKVRAYQNYKKDNQQQIAGMSNQLDAMYQEARSIFQNSNILPSFDEHELSAWTLWEELQQRILSLKSNSASIPRPT